MTKKQRKLLNRIIIAAILFVAGMISPYILPENQTTDYVEFAVFLASYAIIGWDIIWKALCNIRQGQIFDENFLMMIATVGAFILGEHSEGVAVMLFYQVGEWFQSYAVAKSRKSITSLMDIRPDYANVQRSGKLVQVDPDEVQIGEIIIVKPGEKIPIDGIITSGTSTLDTSALTGESLPREAEEGMEVISGCINQTGILTIKTTKEFGESTVAKILDLVENSSEKKARTENFITRFARYYTPIVVFAALALAVIPPLVTGDAFSEWVYRALTFLVISCPCALVISIPLSFFGGLGGASKCGVLVKGSNYLETLADTEIIVFDKTGTLTKGSFAVSQIYTENIQQNKLLEIAAYAENYSNHPISASIKRAYNKNIDSSRIQNVQEIAGHGVSAVIDGKTVLLARQHHMFHNRNRAEAAYERLPVGVGSRPTALIETDTILTGITAQPGSEAVALYVIESVLHCVFLTADEMLRMLRQQLPQLGITLHISHGLHIGTISTLGKAHGQITSVTVTKLQDVAK